MCPAPQLTRRVFAQRKQYPAMASALSLLVPLTRKTGLAALPPESQDHMRCSLRAALGRWGLLQSACPSSSYQTFRRVWLTFWLPVEPEGRSCDTGNATRAGPHCAFGGQSTFDICGHLPRKKNKKLNFMTARACRQM